MRHQDHPYHFQQASLSQPSPTPNVASNQHCVNSICFSGGPFQLTRGGGRTRNPYLFLLGGPGRPARGVDCEAAGSYSPGLVVLAFVGSGCLKAHLPPESTHKVAIFPNSRGTLCMQMTEQSKTACRVGGLSRCHTAFQVCVCVCFVQQGGAAGLV